MLKLGVVSLLILASPFVNSISNQFNATWLDTQISPQSNFFQFANGAWTKSNPIPASEAEWGIFNLLDKNVSFQLKDMLENLPKHSELFKQKIYQELYLYYQSGLDDKTIEKYGITPLNKLINQIKHINNLKSAILVGAKLHEIDIPVFFTLENFNDLHRKDLIIASLYQTSFIMPDRNYYLKTDDKTKQIQQAYQQFLETIFKNLGYSSIKTHQAYKNVWTIEHYLASIANDRDFFRTPKNIDHIYKLNDIQQDFPYLYIKEYLDDLKLELLTELNIANINYFHKLNLFLETLKPEQIQDYFIASLLSELSGKLNHVYEDAYCQYAKAIRGYKQCPPKWQQVINSANYYLGFALGDLYVANYEKKGTISYIQTMIQDIRLSLKHKLSKANWLSDQTKKEALKKLDKMTARIGYPKPLNYQDLNIQSKIFVNNVIESRRFETRRQWEKIGKKINQSEWDMPPQAINAYYDVAQNQINLPLGILQPPFFDLNAPNAANYGGIGVVIGHEIFHGFDDIGSQFNAEGIYKKWWSDEEWLAYQKQVACIANQFSAYKIPKTSIYVQGKLVSGEAIADLGGITLSLDAYKTSNHIQKDKSIDGYTPLQQFFIRFAQIWASNIKKEEALRKGLVDSHPPKEFRVNGTLQNVPEFYEAFAITKPHKSCTLF